MKILVACEFSGIVREAFRERGHDAWSCDLLDTEIPGNHIMGPVEQHLEGWDMIIAHPPCTYLTNSGVRWLRTDPSRFRSVIEGANFFNTLKNADCPRIAIENPIPHKYARELIGRYQQKIQPWLFGHPETKATCLWLKGLPPLMATMIEAGALAHTIHRMPPSPDRAKNRSRTFPGIAAAMANQWGNP